ncbi:transposase [archaeon]|nr:transposase [archaeon]
MENKEPSIRSKSLKETKARRKDTVKKIDSMLSSFKEITFQDEMVKSWYANKKFKFSNKIQNGILGKTYAKLKYRFDDKNNRTIIKDNLIIYKYKKLSSNLRTTKTCICGNVNNNITLKDRVYSCPHCGYINHRDTHSSYIINNTLNHVEYSSSSIISCSNLEYQITEKLNGCGIQPKDYGESSNKDLLLNSNLGQIKTSNNTKIIYNLLCIKFKSLNLSIKLNQKIEDKFYTLEAPSFRSV